MLVEDPAVEAGVGVTALLGPGVGLGPLPLLGHQAAEADLVDGQALLGGHLQGQVDREAVGVVQRERALAGQGAAARLLHLAGRQVEDLGAGLEGLAERLLLAVRHPRDAVPVTGQVGVGLGHLVAADRHQLGQRRVVVPEEAHRADRTTQEAPQDVAPALVARGDPVADEHHRGADVVGDDAEAHVVHVVGAVPLAAELHGALDDGEHDVDLVHVLLALEEVGDALEPHAGVDVLLGQRAGDVEVLLGPHRGELVLHEDEVPDLQVAVLELLGHREPRRRRELTVRPVLVTAVVEDLRARATGAGDAHRPVVLAGAELDDPLGRAGR